MSRFIKSEMTIGTYLLYVLLQGILGPCAKPEAAPAAAPESEPASASEPVVSAPATPNASQRHTDSGGNYIEYFSQIY